MLGMTKGMLGMTPLFLLRTKRIFLFCHAERSETSTLDSSLALGMTLLVMLNGASAQ